MSVWFAYENNRSGVRFRLTNIPARQVDMPTACWKLRSLYTHCIYELRLSEDESFRRVAAARLVKRFPALLDAVASGELHLTGLLLLGPHLTQTNVVEVLPHARHRTKREIAQLVRVLDPLPAVPARIEPLGPAPASPARSTPSAATWEALGRALCPVRELTPGDRPRDWIDRVNDEGALLTDQTATVSEGHGAAEQNLAQSTPLTTNELAAQRYAVQFTATEEPRLLPSAKVVDVQPRPLPSDVRESPRQRGRHIPAAVRRAVFAREQRAASSRTGGTRSSTSPSVIRARQSKAGPA